jgi:hypothetical protein
MIRQYSVPLLGLFILGGCATVDPGHSHPAAPLMLDEDFFYCRIQPEVINAGSCASGAAGDGGSCHSSSVSSLNLDPMAETDVVTCDGNELIGTPPASYRNNFTDVMFTVQPDPLASSFYRHVVGIDSHPRVIFPEGSPEADLIYEWISGGI